MRIAEIFYSIQGEGKLTGVPSVFVRVSGCNLRCVWCDTPYASWNPEGPDMTVAEILAAVETHGARHVVVTGGEPMMFKETVALIHALKGRGKHVTVETAGTVWPEGLGAGVIDLASVSPKLANSTPRERDAGRFAQLHEERRLNVEVLRGIATSAAVVDRQWKFVLSSVENLGEIETLVAVMNADLPGERKIVPADILLMPEGTDVETLTRRSMALAEICLERGYRLSPRLHIYMFGNTRGT